jgi:hypothetical protein
MCHNLQQPVQYDKDIFVKCYLGLWVQYGNKTAVITMEIFVLTTSKEGQASLINCQEAANNFSTAVEICIIENIPSGQTVNQQYYTSMLQHYGKTLANALRNDKWRLAGSS